MNKFFVIIGGTASGKTTLLKNLQQLLPSVRVVVSYTTRKKRETEIAGVDYRFINKDEMLSMQKNGMVDCVRSYNLATGETAYYALPSMRYDNERESHISVLITDVEGFKELKRKYADKACGVFIERSKTECYNSLVQRGDNLEEINRRLKADEKDYANAALYCDYTIHNDFSEEVVIALKKIIAKESGTL